MAANRAREAARQLKDDIMNSMRVPSRSRERNPLKTSGRSCILLINEKIIITK